MGTSMLPVQPGQGKLDLIGISTNAGDSGKREAVQADFLQILLGLIPEPAGQQKGGLGSEAITPDHLDAGSSPVSLFGEVSEGEDLQKKDVKAPEGDPPLTLAQPDQGTTSILAGLALQLPSQLPAPPAATQVSPEQTQGSGIIGQPASQAPVAVPVAGQQPSSIQPATCGSDEAADQSVPEPSKAANVPPRPTIVDAGDETLQILIGEKKPASVPQEAVRAPAPEPAVRPDPFLAPEVPPNPKSPQPANADTKTGFPAGNADALAAGLREAIVSGMEKALSGSTTRATTVQDAKAATSVAFQEVTQPSAAPVQGPQDRGEKPALNVSPLPASSDAQQARPAVPKQAEPAGTEKTTSPASDPVPQGAAVNAPAADHQPGDAPSDRSTQVPVHPSAPAARTESIQPEAASVSGSARPAPLPPEFSRIVIDQVIKNLVLQLDGKASEMRLTLKPESLGEVALKVRMEDGKMQAQFDVGQAAVKAVIESSLPELRQALNTQGIDVQRIDVFTPAESFSRGTGSGQGERPQKRGARRQADVEAIDQYEASRDLGYNTMEMVI